MDPQDETFHHSRSLLSDIDILAPSDDDEEYADTPPPSLSIGQVLGELPKFKSGKIRVFMVFVLKNISIIFSYNS